MDNTLIKLANNLLKPLLRSPLHFLVSHSLMLVNFTGRKTGKIYTTPVMYVRDGKKVFFFSGQNLRWIKNLQGGAPVTLHLHGQDVKGMAVPNFEDLELRHQMLKEMYPKMTPERASSLVLVIVQLI